jgi:hypothetical protein
MGIGMGNFWFILETHYQQTTRQISRLAGAQVAATFLSPISARHGKRIKLWWSPGCIGSFFPFDFLQYMLSYVVHILHMSKVI